MAKLTRGTERSLESLAMAPGWRYSDAGTLAKLQASLMRYGQLRPLLVAGGTVLDGNRLLEAMRGLGWQRAWVLELGLEPAEIPAARLALEVRHETDYAAVARAVSDLLAAGLTPERVAACAPFDAARVAYMDTLTRFDWRQFDAPSDGQAAMAWDADQADVPLAPTVEAAAEELPPVTIEEVLEIEPDVTAPWLVPDLAPSGKSAQARLF